MKPTIRKFKYEDHIKIVRRNWDAVTYAGFPNKERVAKNLERGPAYTMEVDGEIVGCGGIMPLWKGTGEGWIVTSELVPKYKKSVVIAIYYGLMKLMNDLKLERVQTIVLKEHMVSRKWLEWMGFKYEGDMPKYIGGRTYARYALIKNGTPEENKHG